MTDWTEGYVADLAYTYGYYTELNPQRVALAFLNEGLAVPSLGTACELGFGQGLSVNIHAAGGASRWWGTDFNPSQAAFARELGELGGQPALFDQAFDEFCTRPDLPEFDYIGLHGIWSWVSDDNRRVIVDFIRRRLKVGGVLYISYNTMPGWAAFAPMRNLLTAHSEVMGSPGQGRVPRIDSALAFADRLMAANPAYARANPQVADRIAGLKNQNRNYLAHEYFNQDWEPMSFEAMSKWLEPAKLGYACSANFNDHVDQINLTPEQAELLRDIPDPGFRQMVRDFCVNQQFRKDYWVRGARRLSSANQAEQLRKQRVILSQTRAEVPLKVTGSLGAANMQESIYNPILEVLGDHRPRTIGELETTLKGTNITFPQLMQAITLLAGNNSLHATQQEAQVDKAKPAADRLNEFICTQARSGGDLTYLSSPVTGGGHFVPRFSQLFLSGLRGGQSKPHELAKAAWAILAGQGQRILKDGKALESDGENLAELTTQAEVFNKQQLPILKALGIA
jgi:SAM-dependent methyltransferase